MSHDLSHAGQRAVARMVGEHDTRLWRVIHHYVERARARTDPLEVSRIAIDETAARRGHNYITLFVDIDQARVLFATEGKDADTSPLSPTISPRMAETPRQSMRSAST